MKQIGHEIQDAPDVVRQNEVGERILDPRVGPGGFSASAIKHNAGYVSLLGATLLEQAGGHPLSVEDHTASQVWSGDIATCVTIKSWLLELRSAPRKFMSGTVPKVLF